MLTNKRWSRTERKQPAPDETNPNLDEGPVPVRYGAGSAVLRHLGATRIGVWVIGHVVSPLDRWIYQRTGGGRVSTGKPIGPILLLTTTGRRTGREHTTPVFYLRDDERLVVCNVNPGFERPNPWTLNLRANPIARVQIGKVRATYQAREASEAEVAHYWPQLVQVWPAYQALYDRSGQRLVFLLEPIGSSQAAHRHVFPRAMAGNVCVTLPLLCCARFYHRRVRLITCPWQGRRSIPGFLTRMEEIFLFHQRG